MKILHTLPREDGFRMPAEFEPHRGCFMIWPERADSWANGGYAARRAFAKVITAIARSEKVTVLASFAQYENARVSLPPEVKVVEMSTDDAWARDITPTFVKNEKGELRGIDWGFNAWGANGDPFGDVSAPANDWPGGDSHIVYPGYRKLYPSIRLAAMRDGIRDYDLLKLVEARDPQQARAFVETIVFDYDRYDTSVQRFRQIRREILEFLTQ